MPQDDAIGYFASAIWDFNNDHAYGAEYLVFSKGALITVLPTPPDAVDWAYGRLGQMQGWFPPAYVETVDDNSVLPIESASNVGSSDAPQSGDDSESFLGSLVSASYEGPKCFPESTIFKKVGGEWCPVESLRQFDWVCGRDNRPVRIMSINEEQSDAWELGFPQAAAS